MKDFKWFLVTLVLLMIGLLVWMFAETAYAERITVYQVDASGGLNIRKGPGLEYQAGCRLSDEAKVVVVETQDNWGLVNWLSTIGRREPMGWVCMDYLVESHDVVIE